jgi:uncharacterized protein YodC (DUF2158 family)
MIVLDMMIDPEKDVPGLVDCAWTERAARRADEGFTPDALRLGV